MAQSAVVTKNYSFEQRKEKTKLSANHNKTYKNRRRKQRVYRENYSWRRILQPRSTEISNTRIYSYSSLIVSGRIIGTCGNSSNRQLRNRQRAAEMFFVLSVLNVCKKMNSVNRLGF